MQVVFKSRLRSLDLPSRYTDKGGVPRSNPIGGKVVVINGQEQKEYERFRFPPSGTVRVDTKTQPDLFAYLLNYPGCVDNPAAFPEGISDIDRAAMRKDRMENKTFTLWMENPRAYSEKVMQDVSQMMAALKLVATKVAAIEKNQDNLELKVIDKDMLGLLHMAIKGKSVHDEYQAVAALYEAAQSHPDSILNASSNNNIKARYLLDTWAQSGVVANTGNSVKATGADGQTINLGAPETLLTYLAAFLANDPSVPSEVENKIKLVEAAYAIKASAKTNEPESDSENEPAKATNKKAPAKK
jgi:hypothetical protein